MRFREKFDALRDYGVDVFYCPRFSETMRSIAADAFIRRILVHGLNARHIVVGDDFHFARRREGSVAELLQVAPALKFTVEQVPSVIVDGIRVSSTAIREALAAGNVARATALLGKPYRMSGRIMRGRRVGRELGYATANVDLRRRQSAVMGIYAVRVQGLPEGPVDGVASVGTRPTFDLTKPLLEVHLFDFSDEVYGRHVEVDFVERIRDEHKFESFDALREQIGRDVQRARKIHRLDDLEHRQSG